MHQQDSIQLSQIQIKRVNVRLQNPSHIVIKASLVGTFHPHPFHRPASCLKASTRESPSTECHERVKRLLTEIQLHKTSPVLVISRTQPLHLHGGLQYFDFTVNGASY